ncbi:MAG: hypothetical protein Q9170_004920 [Blastenia crenularia]
MSAGHLGVTTRRAYRRTDENTPGKARIELVNEPLPLPLAATKVLVKVHAVALNYRDANVADGGNLWLRLINEFVGTGGVAMFALKLAKAMALHVVLSSSSDEKFKAVCEQFLEPPISIVNYAKNPDWHEEVLTHTNGIGVDIVLANGGPGTLLKSLKCTRRGGIVSQVGYLDRKEFKDAQDILPTLIDRRIILRYTNRPLLPSVEANFGQEASMQDRRWTWTTSVLP